MRQLLGLVILAWTLPPVVGISFLLYIQMFTLDQMAIIMSKPWLPGFIILSFAASVYYFYRFTLPIRRYLACEQSETLTAAALKCVRDFSLHFWTTFLLTLIVAPFFVMFSAEAYTSFRAAPADWFRIHLVSLICSIIVGLPIYFLIFDVFGRRLAAGLQFHKPLLTIKTKVFLIGALAPLLIDTMLVQYYWTRTGFFDLETFVIWFALEILAVGGSLIFVRSFAQSLAPLEHFLNAETTSRDTALSNLNPRSTDELGRLTGRYRELLRQLHQQQEILTLRNSILRFSGSSDTPEAIFDRIIGLACKSLDADAGYLMRFDANSAALVCFAGTGLGYDKAGHFSLPVSSNAFSVYIWKRGEVVSIPDADKDTLSNPEIVQRLKVKSAIGAPLVAGHERIGVLIVVHQNQHTVHTPYDYEVMDALANEASAIIKTQLLHEQREMAESQLQLAHARAGAILQSIGDGVIATDAQGNVEFLNVVAETLTGCSNKDAIGRPVDEVLCLMDAQSKCQIRDPLLHALHNGQNVTLPGEIVLANRSTNSESSIEVRLSPIHDQRDKISGSVIVFHNITELKSLAHELSYQASHDALTGLPNRRAFEKRLQAALHDTWENATEHVFCYLDLDQFKIINDTCGHVAGDALLQQLSSLLQSGIRKVDVFARLGGDEFGLLLEACPIAYGQEIAESLLRTVNQFKFVWEAARYDIGVSIGVVAVNNETQNITDILRAADAACYVAKQLGRNRMHVYKAGDLVLSQHKREMKWSQLIRAALTEKRFTLYMQPLQRLSSGDIHLRGEVLVRMQHASGEIVTPDTFIPAAERYHLMPAIDRFVVDQTCKWLRLTAPGDCYSINLSGQTLCDDNFLEYVLDTLDEHGTPADKICFEITETTAISNLNRAMHFVTVLKQKGCLFALDDFGSGLSSFSYLKKLPIDFLKIDGSFIRDMKKNRIDFAMVEAINHIGHLMNVKTVAEYVADEDIYNIVKSVGIDYAQGYHIAKPMPIEQGLRILPERMAVDASSANGVCIKEEG